MDNSDRLLLDMGKRISDRRKQLGMSQEELAEKADVTPQMLSTSERGAKATKAENLLKISKALNVSVDYLLTGEIIDKDLALIADNLVGKTSEEVRIIEQIIKNCSSLCKK